MNAIRAPQADGGRRCVSSATISGVPLTEMSLNDLAGFLFLQIVEFSHGSANTILDEKSSKLKKLVSRFSRDSQKERDLFKLYFHLLVAYLAVVVVDLQLSDRFSPHAQRITDQVVGLFYAALDQGAAPDSGLVEGDYFIRDADERAIVLSHFTRANPTLLGKVSLPRMELRVVTDMLLERRLNTYREMWLDDLRRAGEHGFVPMMPTKVYQHWGGGTPSSFESLSFGSLLFAGLMPFSDAISQALGVVHLKT